MYHKYFGLEEAPFSIAVNPRYLFMSERHRDALAHLLYGVGVGGGFILLTGEVGTGKTTITRCLLEQLPPKTDVALILNPALDAAQLLAAICDELHIDYRAEERNLKELTDKLHRFLLGNHQRGRNTVLLIDEAQYLQFEALEQIRLLTNLETNTRKLLQIILVGQPELKVILARPELRQLSQRVTARYQLKALSLDETAGYIRHRLQVAGLHANQELFPPRVVQHIHRESQGIPRLINVLCDRILLGTYGQNKSRVDMAMARQATLEVKGEDEARSVDSARWVWPAAGALLALTAVGAFLWWQAQQADIATLAGDAEPLSRGVAPAPDGKSAPRASPSQPAPGEAGPQPVVIAQTPGVPVTPASTALAVDSPPPEPVTVPLMAPGVGVQAPPASVGVGAAGDTLSAVDSPVPWGEEPVVAEPIASEPGIAEGIVLKPTEADASTVASTAANDAAATEIQSAAVETAVTAPTAVEPSATEPTAAEPDPGEATDAETSDEQAFTDTLAPAAAESRATVAGEQQSALDVMVFTDPAAALNTLLVHGGVIDTPLDDPCRRLARERWRCDTLQAQSWPQLLTYKSPVVMEVLTTAGDVAWVVLAGLQGDKVMLAGEQEDYSLTREQLGERWTGTFILPWQKPPGYAGPMRLDDEGEAVSWLSQSFARLDGQPKGLADSRYNELLQQRVELFQSDQLLLVDGVAGTNTVLRVRQLLGLSPVLQVETATDKGVR